MRSVSSPHQKSRKIKRTGRHRGPSRIQRSAKIIGVAIPVLALVGVFVGYEFHQPKVDPVASSAASYQLHTMLSGSAATEVSGKSKLAQPAKGSTPSAKAKPKTSAGAHPAASPASTKHTSSGATPTPAARLLACTGTGGTGMLPLNYATIVRFLAAHGYTYIAAAGIAGNIWQESRGNPESVGTGGGGLIGWTPLPSGFVTGNAAADLQTQLAALLTYNQGWAQYIPMLNAATTPTAASDVYMNYFERPGLPAAYNRESAAVAVAQACGIA